MESKQLKAILNSFLRKNGFLRKSNTWRLGSRDTVKLISLEKSNFGNEFYLNYGITLNNLDCSEFTMHVMNGLGSINDFENRRIKNLLNLESGISDGEREKDLQFFLETVVLRDLNSLETEDDVRKYLLKCQNTNDVPLVVKRYLRI